MVYEPCKMEPDISFRDYGEHYEHVDVYVDDLLIAIQLCVFINNYALMQCDLDFL